MKVASGVARIFIGCTGINIINRKPNFVTPLINTKITYVEKMANNKVDINGTLVAS